MLSSRVTHAQREREVGGDWQSAQTVKKRYLTIRGDSVYFSVGLLGPAKPSLKLNAKVRDAYNATPLAPPRTV